MTTTFRDVALDEIRYSLVWENTQNLVAALDIQPNDHVLAITSAGCNVLNLLLTHPRQVTAVDINPTQNRLLWLKTQVIRQHPYAVYRGILGLDGPEAVPAALAEVLPTLSTSDCVFWKAFFAEHPEGALACGRLERYLHGFYATLAPEFQAALVALVRCETIEAQASFFNANLDVPGFSEAFITYFDHQNLSKGRDPKLYQYAQESSGQIFYQRLKAYVQQHLVRHNFHFLFFFFGLEHPSDEVLPPCYREENYEALRTSLDRLEIVTDEAMGYLQSKEGASVTKAGLSNIFEYTSQPDFKQAMEALAFRDKGLRLVFWTLLNDQGNESDFDRWREDALAAALIKQETCFYFSAILVMP